VAPAPQPFANGLGTAALFSAPLGTPVDARGNVYVADYSNNRVRIIDPSGMVSTLAGEGSAGGANGIGTAASLNGPSDMALDNSGTFGYIVEQRGCRIRSISLTSGITSTLAGTGAVGYIDSPNGLLAQFNQPTSAVWHPSGVLYIGDWLNNRVRRITTSTSAVSTFAGSGAVGSADGVGTYASFNEPRGVAFDSAFTILFVAEEYGHRIRSINLSSALVASIAGNGAMAYVDGFGPAASFSMPLLLASSPEGILYTADYGNSRVRKLTCVPCPASFFCSSGAPVICPPGSYCPWSSVNAIACPIGTFNSVRGSTASSSCLQCPAGAHCSTTGLAVPTPCPAGYYSSAVGASSQATCAACSLAAPGYGCTEGSTSSTPSLCAVGFYCAGGSAGPVQCDPPSACPTSGLSTQLSCVWNVKSLAGGGSLLEGVGSNTAFGRLAGASIDLNGDYLLNDRDDSNRVRRITPLGVVSVVAGNGANEIRDGVGTNAGFYLNTAIAVYPDGRIAVTNEYRVRVISTSRSVTTLAGASSAGYADGVGTTASFNSLTGAALYSNGNLALSDSGNCRIRLIAPTGLVTTSVGNSVCANVDGVGTSASLNGVYHIAISKDDVMALAGDGVNRIRIMTSTLVVTTLAGSGAGGWLDGIGLSTAFNRPIAISFDMAGNIIVGDFSNNRIRRVNRSGFVSTIGGVSSFGPHAVAVTSQGVIDVGEYE
jgi:hypothetical protein